MCIRDSSSTTIKKVHITFPDQLNQILCYSTLNYTFYEINVNTNKEKKQSETHSKLFISYISLSISNKSRSISLYFEQKSQSLARLIYISYFIIWIFSNVGQMLFSFHFKPQIIDWVYLPLYLLHHSQHNTTTDPQQQPPLNNNHPSTNYNHTWER